MPEVPDLTITVGLPASGKSSWAREQHTDGVVLVSRDDIRLMLHPTSYGYTNDKEAQVTAIEHFIIADALSRGLNVVCHDTNLNPRSRSQLAELAAKQGATLTIADFTKVPIEECLRRNASRQGREHVPEHVFYAMAKHIPEED